jgi:hypothetical protein
VTPDSDEGRGAANRPDLDIWQIDLKLKEIDRTLRLAEIRCIPFEDLLSRIEHVWDDPAASELIYHVCQETHSDNELAALSETIKNLIKAAEQLSPTQKKTAFKAVQRILSRMPADIVAPIAEPWLEHKHKFRREMAYRVFQRAGVPAEFGPRLLAAFKKSGDQKCLELIASHPAAVIATDTIDLSESITDKYWRMRVIQSLLISDTERGVSLSIAYPREFTWASGRQKDVGLLPILRGLFDANPGDLDFLSIYIWALGQLGATGELSRMRDLISQLLAMGQRA